MKAMILSDEINQFHWSIMKSVLLILSVLPVAQGILHLWQNTEGSSQIMVGFFALSLMTSWLTLCFCSALKATVMTLKELETTPYEQKAIQCYRYVPMLSLASMLSYLAVQI